MSTQGNLAIPGSEDDEIVDAEVVDESALPAKAEPAGVLTGFEDHEWAGVESGDMAPEPPRTALTAIPMNAKLDGGFTNPDTGEDGILEYDFVWLAKGKTRAAFIEEDRGQIVKRDFDSKNPTGPDCRSFNGATADPNSPLLQNSGDCTTCPLAQWHGSDPPLCRESITAMAFIPDAEGGRLAMFRFRGLSASPARAYWRSFEERLPVIPPIAFITHVSLEPEDTDNGKFLKAHFERGERLTRAEAEPLIAKRAALLAEWEKVVAADVVSDTGASDGTTDETAAARTHHAPGEEPF